MGGKEKGGQLGELVLAFGFEELRRDVGQDGGWSLGDSAELEVGVLRSPTEGRFTLVRVWARCERFSSGPHGKPSCK